MERIEIDNGIISFEIPAGFKIMTQEDAAKRGKKLSDKEWAAESTNLHFILGASWKKAPKLFKIPIDKVRANTERRISSVIKTYKKLSDISLNIDGNKSCGLRYAYSVGDINMVSDYNLIKYNGQYIVFTVIGRAESFDKNYHVFEEMIKSVKLK